MMRLILSSVGLVSFTNRLVSFANPLVSFANRLVSFANRLVSFEICLLSSRFEAVAQGSVHLIVSLQHSDGLKLLRLIHPELPQAL